MFVDRLNEKFKEQYSSNRVFIYHFHYIGILNWNVISEYLVALCQCAKKTWCIHWRTGELRIHVIWNGKAHSQTETVACIFNSDGKKHAWTSVPLAHGIYLWHCRGAFKRTIWQTGTAVLSTFLNICKILWLPFYQDRLLPYWVFFAKSGSLVNFPSCFMWV